jgi:diacylglycerol kinase
MNQKPSPFIRFIRSLRFACNGLGIALKGEQNLRFHFIMVAVVSAFGFALQINLVEWLIVLILFGLVIAVEMLNTSIEKLCNLIHPKKDVRIAEIKDIAAGAVLWISIVAAIAGIIIFFPKVLNFL